MARRSPSTGNSTTLYRDFENANPEPSGRARVDGQGEVKGDPQEASVPQLKNGANFRDGIISQARPVSPRTPCGPTVRPSGAHDRYKVAPDRTYAQAQSMHLMFGDEADLEVGRGAKFLVYGGLIVASADAVRLSRRIKAIRDECGFRPDDPLKFSTRSRPGHITAEQHRTAKELVLTAAFEQGAVFTAYAALHALIGNQGADDRLKFAANTVIGSFHRYLEEHDSHGVVMVDRMPLEHEHRYLQEKFQHGLLFRNRANLPLDRIIAYGATSDGASHLSSVADIVLGSFRYCVNEPERDIAGRALFPQVARLLWTERIANRVNFSDRGLHLRPKKVALPEHRQEYEQLRTRLLGYLVQ